MSALGTALKATGVALLASSAVAVGGIGYGGYKLSTSVSSAIDTVKQEASNGELKENINNILRGFNGNLTTIKNKLESLEGDELKNFTVALTDFLNSLSGKKVVDATGNVVKPQLVTTILSAAAQYLIKTKLN